MTLIEEEQLMTLNIEEQRKYGLLLRYRGTKRILSQPKIMPNSLKHD